MLKKGDNIEIEIEKLVFGGEGLGRYEDFPIFVPGSVPGDVVSCEIISLKKSYGRALIKEIVKKSERRVTPKCNYFDECGGCDFMMMDYISQLHYKKELVTEVLERIGNLDSSVVEDVIPAQNSYFYRNKVIEPFGIKNGKVICGFYKKKSHDIIDIDRCYIQSDISNDILLEIKNRLKEFGVSIYSEDKKSGLLKRIMVRVNSKNEVMLVFVLSKNELKKIKSFSRAITTKFEEVKSIYVSIQRKNGNNVLGKDEYLLFGEESISETISGIEFYINPRSFFQVNREQTSVLYKTALDFFDAVEGKTFIDAYSGTGTIGAILSKKAKFVYGIELIKEATKAAEEMAIRNDIKNIEFINGKVEEELIKLIDKGIKIDSIVFDPPRKGIEESVLRKIADLELSDMVYISCNPSTFARDVAILKEYNYKISKLVPVDMFPNTSHIEIVAHIEKEKLNDK